MGTNPGRPAYPRPAGLAPLRSVPRLQSRGKVTHPQCSESWIGRQFDRMDRKALTWIKGPTRQCQIKHKSVKHLPGTITSVHVRRRCNGGPRGARGRPGGQVTACVKTKQLSPTPGVNQECPGEGGGQTTMILGWPAPPGSRLSPVFAWKLSLPTSAAYN